jgi:sigma-B regulation protein RsbU (phosphoserine phosphatase)
LPSAIEALKTLPAEVRVQRLEALVVASESLNCALGLDCILQEILNLIKAQLKCDRATAFLRDKRAGRLHARMMTGGEPVEIILERGVGLAGHVAETGESLLLNDVGQDPRFDDSTDKRTGYQTKTMLCVPLRRLGGEPIGALQAINACCGAFDESDVAYLESFAALAAVAVEREQLTQEAMRSQMLANELELGRKIQTGLLPPPGCLDLPAPYTAWGQSQPCHEVGGDAYDAIVLPSTGACAFWVADVSGKGIGAALLMTTLQTELRALARTADDLAQLCAALNHRVQTVAPLGTYATLFVGVLNAQEKRLRYVNAGHLAPLWLNAGAGDERKLDSDNFPIGLLPDVPFTVREIPFRPGERLAVFSDGVTDAENMAEEQFEEHLPAALAQLAPRDPADAGTQFFAALDRFRIGAPPKDDTTFMVIGYD